MKTTKQNNPVVVGALLGILAATLYFIVKQMGGGNAPVTLMPVAETHTDEAPKMTAAIVAQSLQRDPFDHPALRRAAKDGTPEQNQISEAQAAQEEAHSALPGGKVPVLSAKGPIASALPILPDHTEKQAVLPVGPVSGVIVPTSPKPTGSGADASVQEAEDPLKGWRLTATIGGPHPHAVIEGVGIGIYRVGVGERVRMLEVTAIHEREIVLSDAHHLYTLPLMSASSALEDSNSSNNDKDAKVETIPTTARENENGTAKIHP